MSVLLAVPIFRADVLISDRVLNMEHYVRGDLVQKLKQDNEFGIGQNLRRLRIRKGLTQVQVVAKLDLYGIEVGRVTYNKMEHNYYSIRIKELMALKQIFECEFNEFFEGIELPEVVK